MNLILNNNSNDIKNNISRFTYINISLYRRL